MITLKPFQDWTSRHAALEKIPHRTLAFLVSSWAHRSLPIFERQHPDDNRPRQAIMAATQCALLPTRDNQKMAYAAGNAACDADASNAAHAAAHAAYAAAYAAGGDSYAAAAAAASAAYAALAALAAVAKFEDLWHWLHESYVQCAHEDREWLPEWTTSETVAIARKCILELDKGDLPYLADALADAGYPHEADLERLRSSLGEWSDWPVWNLIIGTAPAGSHTC